MMRCETEDGNGRQCIAWTALTGLVACVHEHFTSGPICESHMESLRDSDSMLCIPCHISSDPHDCPLRVVQPISV
jgi:hypothetical protein